MTSPINVGGLGSGVQWNDIVDSTMAALKARTVVPITDRITLRTRQREAWTQLRTLMDTLNSASMGVRRAGFGGFSASSSVSGTTGRAIVSAVASSTAMAGRSRVEVLQLADTARVAGAAVTDTTAALGRSGSYTLNGTAITVSATDSLTAIRDRINAANAGVTAAVRSEGGTAGRLVLTSTVAGSSGITVTDGDEGLGRALGFLDSRSRPVSTATVTAAAALGLAVSPPPASIRVGDILITVDLATESIAAIAARIAAAGASASIESEPFGDVTRFRLVVDGLVEADPDDANSTAVLSALGMAAGGFGAVRQIAQSSVFADAGGAAASSATPLSELRVDGAPGGLVAGDAINVRGLRGDGTPVSYGLVIQPGDTVQSLLDRLNDPTAGFGAGTRTATASLGPDGRIRITDDTAGPSRLSFSLTVARASGGTAPLGSSTTAVAGRDRELQQGRDAILRVDGQELTRTTNTITDAIPGVTLTLQGAEPGTSVDVVVSRDERSAVDATRKVVDAYNAIMGFFDEQRQPDAPLARDASLRRVVATLTTALRTEVPENGSYATVNLAGVVLDRTGRLTFNEETFKRAYADKPAEIEALFGLGGVGTAFVRATDDATRFGEGAISVNINTIIGNVETLRAREGDANRRLEQRRQQLVEQFTRMEEALARLQSQSGSLLASMQGLQRGNR
jgi:flagellar hook-associated protein 2